VEHMAGVTLQINLAPPDLKHVRYTLPHQLRRWAPQVDEILLTVDVHRSRGRYGEGWEEGRVGLRALLDECCQAYPRARALEVDYAQEVATRLSRAYFGGQPIPLKDYAGAPFYAYIFGIDAAQHEYVLHMDSDMLFGGGGAGWIEEAVGLLAARGDVFACNPLPGPPTADGTLRSQVLEREPSPSLAYRARGVSTRILLLDRRRLRERLAPITIWPAPTKRQYLQAWLDGNPPKHTLEDCISRAMAKQGLLRIDFLGAAPGMWSLHPPFRSPQFYVQLPRLIEQIETGVVPEGQRGDHDLNDSMVDWTSARRLTRPLQRRAMKHLKLAAARPWLALHSIFR
jgi:hypothetical protein